LIDFFFSTFGFIFLPKTFKHLRLCQPSTNTRLVKASFKDGRKGLLLAEIRFEGNAVTKTFAMQIREMINTTR
jgi:hypothetical protein